MYSGGLRFGNEECVPLKEDLELCLEVLGAPNVFLCFPAPASVFALPVLFCEHTLLDYPVNLSTFLV